MSHFTLIARDLPVTDALAEIDAQPWLWNRNTERRLGNSPHRATDDIWVRFATREAMREADFAQRPHRSEWLSASAYLPETARVVQLIWHEIGRRHGAASIVELGGVLITRVPAGMQVYPHHDRGTWHSEYYTTKVWTILRGNERCVNMVEDEAMVWCPGEAWSHDNLITHSVRNEGVTERICLISCFRGHTLRPVAT